MRGVDPQAGLAGLLLARCRSLGDRGLQAGSALLFARGEHGDELVFRHVVTAAGGGTGHLLGVEGPVVEGCLEETAAEEAVATPWPMPETKEHLALACLVGQGGAGPRGLTVGDAIAKALDRSVCSIDDRQVHRPVSRPNLIAAGEGIAAGKAVAPCNPAARLSLPKDDRIKQLAVERFHGDRSAAALVERTELNPGLDGLFAEVMVERGRLDKALPIEHQGPVFEAGVAHGGSMQAADGVVEGILKLPAGHRRRWGRPGRVAGVPRFQHPLPGRRFECRQIFPHLAKR